MENADEFITIPPDQLKDYSCKESISSHCMIFARLPGVMSVGGENLEPRGAVLMQLRFDGKLGFAGGLRDGNENPVEAVNREMQEEINLDLTSYFVEAKDYIVTHYNKSKDSVHHFYALEVSSNDFKKIEEKSLQAKEFGDEVMGILRAPLYTRKDGLTGFPTFLTHTFVGCSYLQLLTALEKTNLLSAEEIQAAQNIRCKIKNQNKL